MFKFYIQSQYLTVSKDGKNMYECPKDCLSCANSFSEPSATNTEKDVLHCMIHNEKVVDENYFCEDYN